MGPGLSLWVPIDLKKGFWALLLEETQATPGRARKRTKALEPAGENLLHGWGQGGGLEVLEAGHARWQQELLSSCAGKFLLDPLL
jgi:hypothetical protein